MVKKRKVLVTKKVSSTRTFKVSKNALLVNKNLLKGQKLLKHFPGFGNSYGTGTRFNLELQVEGACFLSVHILKIADVFYNKKESSSSF